MSDLLRVGILASTNGSILPSIFSAALPGVEYCVFVTNKKACGAREKAKRFGVPDYYINPEGMSREEWDAEVVKILQEYNVDLVLLVGFMRILSPVFIQSFSGRILNVHPSLLPKFAGGMNADVHRAVLEAGETETGSTIHFVTEEVDGGPIFLQEKVDIVPDETVSSLKEKVQDVERVLFPEAIQKFQQERSHTENDEMVNRD